MYTVIQRGPLGRRIRTVECDTLGRANDLASEWSIMGMTRVYIIKPTREVCIVPRYLNALHRAMSL